MSEDFPIAVIIPWFRKPELVSSCLAANLTHSQLRLHWVIIDNESSEQTRQALQQFAEAAQNKGHRVTLLPQAENTGVAKAWNIGLSHATQSPFICILNNDCVLEPDWDALLIQAAKEGPLDLFSPYVLEQDKPNEKSLLSDVTLAQFLDPAFRLPWKQRNVGRTLKDFFSGIVLFGKTTVFEKIGRFDETYWLSMEDIDYEHRARQHGYQIGINGSILAFHLVSATRREVPQTERANQMHFFAKYGWDFPSYENAFFNKKKRSYLRWMERKKGLLSTWARSFPH